MFREMRRSKQIMTESEYEKILKNATHGTLSLQGDNGYPYCVPLSFVYDNNKIYFHCAVEGYKNDCIKANNKACFCVVAQDDIIPQKFTTAYKSVIVFGKLRFLENTKEKTNALLLLAEKYCPKETKESTSAEIDGSINRTAVLELTCQHISGKKAKEHI